MNQQSREGYYKLQTGLNIFPSQFKAIDQLLNDLVKKIPARFVLLTDVTGQMIATQGEPGQINLVALGALIASDLAASQEIARLMGEYQDYQLILREGQKTDTFIAAAGPHLVLLVQVSKEEPLGWARMLIQEATHQLADVAAMQPKIEESADVTLGQEDLSNLFSQALDDLWWE